MAKVMYPFRTDCFGNHFLSSIELAGFKKLPKPWRRIQRLLSRVGASYVHENPAQYLYELEEEGQLLVVHCTSRLESLLGFSSVTVTLCDDPIAAFVALDLYEEQYWKSYRSDCTVEMQKKLLRRFLLDTVQAHYVDVPDFGYELPDERYEEPFSLKRLAVLPSIRFDSTIIWESGEEGGACRYDAEKDRFI